MADLKKLAEDASTKAAIAAGRDAAKRAVDDFLSSDEDKAAREVAKSESSKGTRWKLIAFAVLGLFLFVGLVGMLLNYWYWFLALGVLGVVGIYGFWKLRGRLARKKENAVSSEPEKAALPAKVTAKVRVEKAAEDDEAPSAAAAKKAAAERRAESEARARAAAEARVVEEQEVDEELAALKARMKK